MPTQTEAIIEALEALGGVRTISEIKTWVTNKYGENWKDFATVIADMVPKHLGGNNSAQIHEKYRVLERVGKGSYRLISGADVIETLQSMKHIFQGLAKRSKEIKTLSSYKLNWITNVSQNEIYVETEESRQKQERGECRERGTSISFDFMLLAWKEFTTKRIASANDFVKTRGRTSFLMAFFAQLPFVEVVQNNGAIAIELKEFKTDDLPSEQFHKVIIFLEEIIEDTYDPVKLSRQIEDQNVYRIKTRGRQDLRLLGFLDEQHNKNEGLFNGYTEAENKNHFLKEQILSLEYFQTALFILEMLRNHTIKEKKQALCDIGMLIVRNSRGDNLMVESVAKERTHNLLMWLQEVNLIDEDYVPTIHIESNEEIVKVKTNLRASFLHIMQHYLKARTEPFGGHQMGTYMRSELTGEVKKLPFITPQYNVVGSVGQGNWATVPWLGVLNTTVTNSTQRGYYIVYLFSEDMQRLYLTLAQGVTETSKEEMAEIKEEIQQAISMNSKVKKDDQIYIGESKRARDYQYSTAAYILYSVEQLPSEEELVRDLEDMVSYYEMYIEMKTGKEKTPSVEYEVVEKEQEHIHDEEEVHLPTRELVNHIYQFITGKGFYYEKDEVTNLYLSLKTKPFVIISGISGTGKTKIVQWFAESVGATERNGQLNIIPVRPDWSDGSDLLGYIDIKGDFKEGPLTKILVKAIDNPNRPYFVLLDEMNLARVEHYFSDLLSVMESRKWENGQVMTSPVLDEKTLENDIHLPANVYIIGTVNMDETTHPFSKKVLDRANTIEFNRVKLDYLRFLTDTKEIDPVTVHNEAFETKYLHLKDVYTQQAELVEEVTAEIVKINEALQLIAAHVGYRVRDEICFYMAYNEKSNLLSYNDALDRCILQKILPRISGSDTRVERVLKVLYKVFTNKELPDVTSVTVDDISFTKYPKSTEKVVEMLRRLDEDGFTSFWIGS